MNGESRLKRLDLFYSIIQQILGLNTIILWSFMHTANMVTGLSQVAQRKVAAMISLFNSARESHGLLTTTPLPTNYRSSAQNQRRVLGRVKMLRLSYSPHDDADLQQSTTISIIHTLSGRRGIVPTVVENPPIHQSTTRLVLVPVLAPTARALPRVFRIREIFSCPASPCALLQLQPFPSILPILS